MIFHSCFVESQDPSPWGILWILSDSGLCPLKIAGRWFFLHFHVSCFSKCLAALTVDAGVSAIAHMLYSCSAKVYTCAQWACANSIWQQHDHRVFTSPQCCETTGALSQHNLEPPNFLWQPPAGSRSHAFSKWRPVGFGSSSSLCPVIHFMDLCTHICCFAVTKMLWCTALRGIWAISGWGRYWWDHTAAYSVHPSLPLCCKAGRNNRSLPPSFNSLVMCLKPIW